MNTTSYILIIGGIAALVIWALLVKPEVHGEDRHTDLASPPKNEPTPTLIEKLRAEAKLIKGDQP